MKKCLFMLFALCGLLFASCSSDDDNSKTMPKMSPNNTELSFDAAGGTKTITVENAEELNITQINDKETTTTSSGSSTSKDTNVMSISNGKLKDSKNVTEGGWFTVKVEQVDGVYKKLTFTANQNTGSARQKWVHVTCGGNLYAISFRIQQSKSSPTTE